MFFEVHAEKEYYNTLGGLNGYVSGIFISSWYLPPKKWGENKIKNAGHLKHAKPDTELKLFKIILYSITTE